jgi:hypothetical protein
MKSRFPLLAIFISIVLYGCASASKTFDQYGNPVYDVSCPGMAIPISVCYDKAMEVCPNGYYLVGKDTGSGSVGTLNSTNGATTSTYASGINKGIIIKCK